MNFLGARMEKYLSKNGFSPESVEKYVHLFDDGSEAIIFTNNPQCFAIDYTGESIPDNELPENIQLLFGRMRAHLDEFQTTIIGKKKWELLTN